MTKAERQLVAHDDPEKIDGQPRNRNVFVDCEDGSHRKVDLADCALVVKGESERFGAGRDLLGVWRKGDKVIVGTNSRWDTGHGETEGPRYHVADTEEIAGFAREAEELLDLVPAL